MVTESRAGVLSRDTDAVAERIQVDAWRQMTTMAKAQLVADASRSIRALAIAGLRGRHPDASETELIARLAALTFGRSLAVKVYPALAHLDDHPARD